MPQLLLRLPDVQPATTQRPSACPHCGCPTLQRWGQVKKPVKDTQLQQVTLYRYRCIDCGRTFRHYPSGCSRADQTERLLVLLVLAWCLGLSLRGVSLLLSGFGIGISWVTVWRDVQQLGSSLLAGLGVGRRVRVVGVDGFYVRRRGQGKVGVVVAVDLGSGEPLALGYVREQDVEALCGWLSPLVERYGIEVLVTDSLHSYQEVGARLGLVHQECQVHVRRWVGRALRELAGELEERWHWVLEEVRAIVEELPADGGGRLLAIWKQLPGRDSVVRGRLSALVRLRDLVLCLRESWGRFVVFVRDSAVPRTNNGVERVIGRMQVRARTVRGYKSVAGMLHGLAVCGCRWW